ncbi:tail protein X [Labrenzia sp. R4_1]|uniref:tail protein X n=1 Tax=Labrenzia sp. R4_1 TaxID=2821106 RepID=UPI001ADB32D2|nr:tail protein X [Labrenzia sp. R4_1]MBO9424704.1 tail protein X [Labrenzia sp. R4_1]
MPETIRIVGDNITLDLLLWRRHGVRGQDLVEEALTLNPKQTNPFLVPGSDVVIPDLPAEAATRRKVVTLFGER